MATYSESKKKSSVLNIISNVLFVIVMILLIIFMIYGFGNLSKNKVPSFFGQSYVRIMSGSMEASGFEKGDIAVIEKKNISEIGVGDIIAFYYCAENPSSGWSDSAEIKDFKTGENSFDTQIIFHQVIDIKVDSEGNVWFQTKGTSNLTADKYTKADYVVGVYKDSIIADILQFMSSTAGIIVIVIVPSCIVLFLLLLNIIDIVDKMIKARREEEERQVALIEEGSRSNDDRKAAEKTDDKAYSDSLGLSNIDGTPLFDENGNAIFADGKNTKTATKADYVLPRKPVIKKDGSAAAGAASATIAANATKVSAAPKKPAVSTNATTTSGTTAAKPAATAASKSVDTSAASTTATKSATTGTTTATAAKKTSASGATKPAASTKATTTAATGATKAAATKPASSTATATKSATTDTAKAPAKKAETATAAKATAAKSTTAKTAAATGTDNKDTTDKPTK